MSRLLEREAQLSAIERMTGAAAGGEGALLAIVGGPGEGKSALLEETCRFAADAGMAVRRARGSELERGFALGAARQLLEPAVRELDARERAELLRGAAALAASALDVDAEPPPERSFATLHGLYWLLVGLAERRPLLLALDDAHWADPGTLEWLCYVARRSEGLPLTIAVATRPPNPEMGELRELFADRRLERLEVAALGREALAMLAARSLDAEPHERFAAELHRVTGGNPFAAHELLGELRRAGAAPSEDAAAQLGTRAPERLRQDVLRRLERLGEPALDAARALAVLGDGAPPRLIAALGELDAESAARALDALAGEGMLLAGEGMPLAGQGVAPAGDAAGLGVTRPAFAHPLLRAAVYEALPEHSRARMHARAAALRRADGAPAETIAAQLLRAGGEGSAANVADLRAAATDAVRRGAPQSAAAYLARALEEPPPAPQRGELLGELGQAELLMRDPAALGHLREAIAVGADPAERVRLRWMLSDALLFGGDWDAALAELRGALAELAERGADVELWSDAHPNGTAAKGARGNGAPRDVAQQEAALRDVALRLEGRLLTLGTLDARAARDGAPAAGGAAVEERTERLRRHAERAGELDGVRPLRLNLALLLAVRARSPAEVAELVRRGFDGGRFLEREGSDAIEAVHGAFALVLVDDLEGALAHTDAMLADAARRGSVLGFLAGASFRALANLRRGALVEAEADAAPALELAMEQGLTFTIPFTAAYLALTLLERGQAAQAVELLAPIPLDGELAGTPAGITLLEARGRVHRALGDLPRALADLRACGEACAAIGVLNPNIVAWRSELALALRAQSPERNIEQAYALASEELALAERAGVARGIGVAQRARALLADGAEREALLVEAVATLEQTPARLELARALADLGAHLRRDGQRTRAREPLGRALQIAHEARAEPLATQAREELLAAGARPRRPWSTGVDALTPSELRVARLAADGASNQEIAQALFVTTQTVKGHLSGVYRKLGVGGRGELADALVSPRA
jgi:DNA-binding CsgD family transcriptional regulator